MEIVRAITDSPAVTDASSVRDVRMRKGKEIARRRSVTYNTVMDRIIRQLRPEIRSVSDFENMCLRWKQGGSPQIFQVLLAHSVDEYDRQLILQGLGSGALPTDPDRSRSSTKAEGNRLYLRIDWK